MPMIENPRSSCVLDSVIRLQQSLADSAACQTFLGVATASEAIEKIHFAGLPGPNDDNQYTDAEYYSLFPFVMIELPADGGAMSARPVSRSGGVDHELSGSLQFAFEAMAQDGDSVDINESRFAGLPLKSVEEILDMNGDTHLEISALETLLGPARAAPELRDDLGDVNLIVFRVDWGLASQ